MRGGIARVLGLGILVAGVARGADGASGWRDQVTFTLSQRIRGEFVDWFRPPAGKAPSGANRYNFLGNQLRYSDPSSASSADGAPRPMPASGGRIQS